MLIVFKSKAAVLVTLYLSEANGTNPIFAKYPLLLIAFLDVNSLRYSWIPGITPTCAFLT